MVEGSDLVRPPEVPRLDLRHAPKGIGLAARRLG
jgi:hypothetical protein